MKALWIKFISKNFYLSAKGIVRFKGVKKFLILTLNQILTTLSADFLRILADPRNRVVLSPSV